MMRDYKSLFYNFSSRNKKKNKQTSKQSDLLTLTVKSRQYKNTQQTTLVLEITVNLKIILLIVTTIIKRILITERMIIGITEKVIKIIIAIAKCEHHVKKRNTDLNKKLVR